MEAIVDRDRKADPTHLLQGNPGQNVGVSVVMITSMAGVADLQNTTRSLLASMSHFPPQISTTNSTSSWFQVGPPPKPTTALPECLACLVSLPQCPLAVRQWSPALATAPCRAVSSFHCALLERPACLACMLPPLPCMRTQGVPPDCICRFPGMLSFYFCSSFSPVPHASSLLLHLCPAAVACSHTCAW